MYLVSETLMMTSFYLFGIFYTKYHLSIVNLNAAKTLTKNITSTWSNFLLS